MASWAEILTSEPLLQKSFILRKLRVANVADIIKISTMFLKKSFKDSNKVKRLRNYVLKCNLTSVFLDIIVADLR